MLKVMVAASLALAGVAAPAAAQNYGYPGGGYDNGGGYTGGGYNNGPGYGGGYGPGYGGPPLVRQIVTCQSWNYQPARCPVDTRRGVVLQRQIAGSCNQGQTWGYNPGSIWVAGGCRAVFIATGLGNRPGYGGGGFPPIGIPQPAPQPRFVTCASILGQPRRCAVDIYRSAAIRNLISGPCVLGRTWGWDRGGVWVNNGCAAVFTVF